jgi:2-polyprenyl-3-methyl-5-hydroxy-6-metoxy-1,4-benzoquinol methylase
MRKFNFTRAEIDANSSSREQWHNFVRRREAEMAFSLIPGRRFGRALELGAGDGGQSTTIARYCEHLVCTEMDPTSHAWLGQGILDRRLPNVAYELCDAQDLSRYADASFDLVFSSNMLEHIPDVDRCLRECRRVLKDDGLMLHAMPSRWWKLFNAGINLARRRPPGIHGVSSSQREEFHAFGEAVWRARIASNGLRVVETVGLPFYPGHWGSVLPLIRLGNRLGLSASYLYVVRKG